MVTWNNLDKLASFEELKKVERVNLAEVMSGENGAERVKSYSVPMAEGLAYNYAAKQVNEDVLAALVKLAEEAQLSEKFEELYNGAVINTGENRRRASSADPRPARKHRYGRRRRQTCFLRRAAEPHRRVCEQSTCR